MASIGADGVLFPAPTNLDAVVTNIHTIDLSWSYNLDHLGSGSFQLERSFDGGANWFEVAANISVTTYTDSSYAVVDQGSILYRVRAVSGNYYSAFAPLQNPIDNTFPAPQDLTVTQTNVHTFDISWSYNPTGHTGFVLSRQINNEGWLEVDTLGSDVHDYTDNWSNPRSNLETVSYRLKAYYSWGDNGENTVFSDSTMASIGADEVLLPAPTDLRADIVNETTIHLSWTYPANWGEDGFFIERSIDEGDFMPLVTGPIINTSYNDVLPNLPEYTSVRYRVSAYYGNYFSLYIEIIIY
jgi:hypothetical protein